MVGRIELIQGQNSVSCSWTVEPGDFFSIENTGESLKSPIISCFDERNKPTAWQIIVYPKGNTQQELDYVSVFLKSLNSNPCEVSYKLTFPKVDYGSITQEFTENLALGYLQLMKQKVLCSSLNVNIGAQVRFIRNISIPKPLRNKKLIEQLQYHVNQLLQYFDNTHQLVEDIGNIFLNDDISDCKIVCEGREISCHVVILAARSPVFAAMMAQPLKEKETREICIEDFTFQIVKGEF